MQFHTQANRNNEKASLVVNLYKELRDQVVDLTKSPYALRVVDALFSAPIMKTADFIKASGIEPKSAHRIILKLKSENILLTIQKHSGRTSEILVFDQLYRIIR